jgi:hypothetical protein
MTWKVTYKIINESRYIEIVAKDFEEACKRSYVGVEIMDKDAGKGYNIVKLEQI